MADSKLSALAALTGANSASGDLLYIDDISVTTSKSITRAELAIGMNATQAEQETGTATNKLVSPAVQQYHPCAAKAFVQFTVSGTTVTVNRSYNVTSVVRNSTGDYTITFTTAFSDAFYSFSVSGDPVSNGTNVCYLNKKASGTYSTTDFQIAMSPSGGASGGQVEASTASCIFFGDQ